ncbi:hypothetical protein ACHAW6_013689 [Cyclotella cf. meneghiniana]
MFPIYSNSPLWWTTLALNTLAKNMLTIY